MTNQTREIKVLVIDEESDFFFQKVGFSIGIMSINRHFNIILS